VAKAILNSTNHDEVSPLQIPIATEGCVMDPEEDRKI